MMNRRLTAMALAGAFAALPIVLSNTVATAKQPQRQVVAQRPTTQLLQNLPAQSSNFQGTVSITRFAYPGSGKQVLVSGVLNGKVTKADGTQETVSVPFTDIPSTLRSAAKLKQVGSCQILFLDLGPIFLDLLGLQVDLSEITLDITAVQGAGNLLGNLLCALVGLLDSGGLLTGVQTIINQINVILGGL